MIEVVAHGCIIVLGLSIIPALWRIVRGPSVPDRAVGVDVMTTHIMAIVVLTSIESGSRMYFDAVMAMAILGFFGTVALAKYIQGGRAID
jgi:multisubunit Na+/H+ antiporter MnhF subunit